jgi:glycosyltransferase involved in cell wall biosynthesis
LHIWGANRMPIDYQHMLRSKGINNLFLKGPNNNIIELLPEYDLFISSSKYESFGLSVLEAMACNIPVLLSDIPAFKELYNEYATFFHSDSTIDFIEKLNQILKNKEKIGIKANSAFLYAKKFSVQNTVKEIELLYQSSL